MSDSKLSMAKRKARATRPKARASQPKARATQPQEDIYAALLRLNWELDQIPEDYLNNEVRLELICTRLELIGILEEYVVEEVQKLRHEHLCAKAELKQLQTPAHN